jgi:hypothetical protein
MVIIGIVCTSAADCRLDAEAALPAACAPVEECAAAKTAPAELRPANWTNFRRDNGVDCMKAPYGFRTAECSPIMGFCRARNNGHLL